MVLYWKVVSISSLLFICFPVSLSKIFFLAVTVSGGIQENKSHVPGVGELSAL